MLYICGYNLKNIIMKKDDVICYLKILGGISLVFPLVLAIFIQDFGALEGSLISIGIYIVLMLIGIPMFNYLQYGIFWYWISEKQRKALKMKNYID